MEHCGPNDDSELGSRSIKELNKWKKNDNLNLIQIKLNKKYKLLKKIENKIRLEVKNAFNLAEKSEYPKYKELLEGVYES